jgi:hypothetical protein
LRAECRDTARPVLNIVRAVDDIIDETALIDLGEVLLDEGVDCRSGEIAI